jgi:hypothetical protein
LYFNVFTLSLNILFSMLYEVFIYVIGIERVRVGHVANLCVTRSRIFIAGLLWATGRWTVGPMSGSGILAPVPRPVGPTKVGTTQTTKHCNVTRT